MEHQTISEKFEALTDNLKRFIGLRLEVVKCVLTEALARMGAIMLRIFIISLLVFLAVLFVSLAFAEWFAEYFSHKYIGTLIVALFYILVIILVYLLRNRLFLNPIISACSKIFFEEENDEEK